MKGLDVRYPLEVGGIAERTGRVGIERDIEDIRPREVAMHAVGCFQ
jgi:hypothetical protein